MLMLFPSPMQFDRGEERPVLDPPEAGLHLISGAYVNLLTNNRLHVPCFTDSKSI